jgi:hypothetical protein
MNMIVGQDDLTRQQEPAAIFELGVNYSPDRSNDGTAINPSDSKKTVSYSDSFLGYSVKFFFFHVLYTFLVVLARKVLRRV